MYTLKKTSPAQTNAPDTVRVIGSVSTEDAAVELLRAYLLNSNRALIKMSESIDVPQMIVELATASVEMNADLDIVVRHDRKTPGIVFINDVGPEMDYFTVTEDDKPNNILPGQDCVDNLLPGGEVCPRCGERRGPSGVDGGSWVHY